MKERCCDKEKTGKPCTRLAEAFRNPEKPYTSEKYKAYCNSHGGDDRAREEIRRERHSDRAVRRMSFSSLAIAAGVVPLKRSEAFKEALPVTWQEVVALFGGGLI